VLDKKNKKLGKGLSALMKQPPEKDLIMCRMEDIVATENQPRKNFDEDRLKELSESIREHGIIQPIVVKKEGNKYRIIAGERRFRAAKLLGMREVKVMLYKGEKDYQVALIENIQREDLNAVDIAEAYSELLKRYDYTQQELSEKVGKSRSDIANHLRLLQLSEKVKNFIREGVISFGQARPLTTLSEEEQNEYADRIISEKLSARSVEKIVKEEKKAEDTETRETAPTISPYAALESEIAGFMPASVKIKQKSKKKIAITLEFSNQDEFDNFISEIKSGKE